MHRAVSLFASSWSRASVCAVTGLIPHRCVQQLAVSKPLLRDFNQHIRDSPQNIDQSTILRLLRNCAIGLIMEVPQKRVYTANQMWSSLKRIGTKMDVSLHNGLLRVYISNNHKFSPSQFMEGMSAAGVVPNQSTLNLLLNSHCQHGDLVGAQSILQHMYEKGHTVTEQVYANLITGHAQSGNMDEAWKMLDVMEENGFEPGIASYTALLQGHAYHGEIERVRETLQKIVAKKMYPGHDVYIAVLDSLSMGGHHSFLNEILDLIADKEWITYDLLQLAQTAAGRGECESSMQILTTVLDQPLLVVNQHRLLVRASFTVFHHMIMSQQPVRTIFDHLKRLSAMDLGERTWKSMLNSVYYFGSSEMIVATLREMNAKGDVVKIHYLYPAIAKRISSNDFDGVKECLKLLNEYDLGIDQTVGRLLLGCNWGISNMFTLMKESGLLDKDEERKNFISQLCVLNLRVTVDIVKKTGLLVEAKEDILDGLVDHCKIERPDSIGLAKVFKMLYSSSTPPPMDELTACIEKCVAELLHNVSAYCLNNFLTTLVNEGIPLSDDTYSNAESTFGSQFVAFLKQQSHNYDAQKQLPSEPASGTSAARTSDKIIKLFHKKHIGFAMDTYRTMVDKGQKPTYSAQCYVATVVVRSDTVAAEEMIREVESKGFVPGPYIRNAFIDFYSKRGDVENARRHFDLLIQSDIVPTQFSFQRLMAAYSYHGDVDMVEDLIKNEAQKYGFQHSQVFVGQLVEAYVNNNDLEVAVAAIETSEDLPDRNSLYKLVKRLIEKKEAGLLERVEALLRVRNKSFVYGMVLEAYLDCGNTEEAKELAKRDDFEVKSFTVTRICYRLASAGKVESIRCLFQILQKLDMDTLHLHTHLLNAYAQLGDVEGMITLQKELIDSGLELPSDFSSVMTKQLHRLGVSPREPPVHHSKDAAMS